MVILMLFNITRLCSVVTWEQMFVFMDLQSSSNPLRMRTHFFIMTFFSPDHPRLGRSRNFKRTDTQMRIAGRRVVELLRNDIWAKIPIKKMRFMYLWTEFNWEKFFALKTIYYCYTYIIWICQSVCVKSVFIVLLSYFNGTNYFCNILRYIESILANQTSTENAETYIS